MGSGPGPDLRTLARYLGVATTYEDGLGRRVRVGAETLVRVCRSLGAEMDNEAGAATALAGIRAERSAEHLAPVVIAWDGCLTGSRVPTTPGVAVARAAMTLEDGTVLEMDTGDGSIRCHHVLPPGRHRLEACIGGHEATAHVISAPSRTWSAPTEAGGHRGNGPDRAWGLAAQLPALRSSRSRSVADLTDLEAFGDWVADRGGRLVTVLPLLPTFNELPAEPSPYSPVSRLFWSELILDLGVDNRPVGPVDRLDVVRAAGEVRAALVTRATPPEDTLDPELVSYARFRGAQRRLGRDWRDWPEPQRSGVLGDDDIDPEEYRFHLTAQVLVRDQLADTLDHLGRAGLDLGLDLAVGVHPEGYDAWSRSGLFAHDMSVGAPPDAGFPSGQGWGFPPLLPRASRAEGHTYFGASVAHQASRAGVLRLDHIMSLTRLYWIPEGMGLDEGTYVNYPLNEMLAVLSLESHRNSCRIIGEDLGTVPADIETAMSRHAVAGMYLAEFAAGSAEPVPAPGPDRVAMIGTHDTPPLAGWVAGTDIDERIRLGLLAAGDESAERRSRARAVTALARTVGARRDDPESLLENVLDWLGRSHSPLVVPWLEDLWGEECPVNIPGSGSAARPNWQRPMRRLLDEITVDPRVSERVATLDRARRGEPGRTADTAGV